MSMNDPLLPVLPPEAPDFRPVRGLAIAASVLVAVVCVLNVAATWLGWTTYQLILDYLAGLDVTYEDLLAADRTEQVFSWVTIAGWVAAISVFLVWLWRARGNAEALSSRPHRLARGWAVGGWIVPIVNFWFPFRIVHDIWWNSRPPAVEPAARPVHRWWAAWVASLLAGIWVRVTARSQDTGPEWARELMVADTVATVFLCVAGVFVVLTIRQITAWQETPRPA